MSDAMPYGRRLPLWEGTGLARRRAFVAFELKRRNGMIRNSGVIANWVCFLKLLRINQIETVPFFPPTHYLSKVSRFTHTPGSRP